MVALQYSTSTPVNTCWLFSHIKMKVFLTEQQEINNRIATIEFQLCTESVPLKEAGRYVRGKYS